MILDTKNERFIYYSIVPIVTIGTIGDEMKKTIELKQTPTTVWIKKGTKELLDSLGSRKDTYDDIIRRLVKENEAMKQALQDMQKDIGETENQVNRNRIKISRNKTRHSEFVVSNTERIEYTYEQPPSPLDEDYRLDIIYTKVIFKNKALNRGEDYKDHIEMTKDYLRIVEHIIKLHIDPLFKIDEKHMFDLSWWKRMFENSGLSHTAYQSDIELALIKRGIVP